MSRLLVTLTSTALTIVATGCQVAQQAASIFEPSKNTNHLEIQTIQAISSLSLNDYKVTNRHDGEILALQGLSSMPPTAISVGQDGRVVGWDMASGQGHEVKQLTPPPKLVALGGSKSLIAWSDGQRISVACIHGCTSTLTLTRLKVRPTALSFHDLDTTLLIGGADGRMYRWRFIDEQSASSMEEREKMVERYIGHKTVVSGVAEHSGGRAFFSSDWDGALVGWLSYTSDDHKGAYDKNIFRGRFYTDIPAYVVAARPHDRGISSLTISKDGERLAVGTEDGFVEIWTIKGFTMAARKQLHQGRITSVALTDDGERVASVGKDSKVRVQELAPDPMHLLSPSALPKLLTEVSEHHIPLAQTSAFVSARRLAVGTRGGELVELTLTEPAKSTPIPTPKAPSHVQDSDY